jgi:hypothetical protein
MKEFYRGLPWPSVVKEQFNQLLLPLPFFMHFMSFMPFLVSLSKKPVDTRGPDG